MIVADREAGLAAGRARMDAAREASAAAIRANVRAPHAYLPGNPIGTSKGAAKSVQPRSGTQRYKVLMAISAAGDHGLTDEELVEQLGMSPNTERPRRLELVEAGFVVDSGQRRPTRSACEATVWVVA